MRRTVYIKKKKQQIRWRKLALISITLLTAFVTAYGALRLYVQVAGAPSLHVPKATIFLSQNETQIGDRFSAERRYWVPLKEISPFLIDAVIATEDKKFFTHNGFDYRRIAGAVLKDIKSGRKAEGASTITQQYARNLYLTHEKTWKRKANEALYAYRMEKFYEKDKILEGYLNTVYFGHGMYGVEAASKFYFGKQAKDITLEEAAIIIAIAKGPSLYSPIDNPTRSTERKKLILSLMKNLDYITATQEQHALEAPITLKNAEWKDSKRIAPYFLDTVWKEAEGIIEKKGRYPAEGGWTIQTTLNEHHQKVAEETITKWLLDQDLQVGFMSVEPETGFVTALVGGIQYSESTFNRVTQAKRQPGSAIKPILYAAALENGFSPLTFLSAEKTIFTYDDGRSSYEPKNINGKFAQHPISLAQALAISDNIFAVKTLQEIGYDSFREMSKRLGIHMKIPSSPAVALGTSDVTLFDMTNAYNRIASEGKNVQPITVLSIIDSNGKVIYEREKPKYKQVLSKQDAFILTHLLTGMFDPVFNDYSVATGLTMRQKQTRPYAAKSGTTLSDQYIIGFSPSLTTGIWTGYDDGSTLTEDDEKSIAKKIWIDFMEEAHSGKRIEAFVPPKGVESVIVDVNTGGIATPKCDKQRLMYMKKKDVPEKSCTDRSLKQTPSPFTKPFKFFPFDIFE